MPEDRGLSVAFHSITTISYVAHMEKQKVEHNIGGAARGSRRSFLRGMLGTALVAGAATYGMLRARAQVQTLEWSSGGAIPTEWYKVDGVHVVQGEKIVIKFGPYDPRNGVWTVQRHA